MLAEWLLDPAGPPPRPQVILHLHGGAHVLQDLRGYREYNGQVSMMTRCRVYSESSGNRRCVSSDILKLHC